MEKSRSLNPPSPQDDETARCTSTEIYTCSICHYPPWTYVPPDFGSGVLYGKQYDEIKSSSRHGCMGCGILKEAINLAKGIVHENRGEADPDYDVVIVHGVLENLYEIMITDPYARHMELFMLPSTTVLPNVSIASLIPPTTNLEQNLSKIKQWIVECEESHARCSKPSHYLPLRLLDIGSHEDKVTLIDSQSIVFTRQDGFRYAALSHCWGNTRSKHLTREGTLRQNQHGIPLHELPNTFQDAILTARALEIPYLWIDSLCIIQDDRADWDIHVEAMVSIYRYAYITLAAGASVDDDGGFFRTPRPPYGEPRCFTFKEHGQQHGVYLRRRLDHPEQIWSMPSPLMKRGWTFQERLLSRRFLCFGPDEVQWECGEAAACSCSASQPGLRPYVPDDKATKSVQSVNMKFRFAHMDSEQDRTISQFWHELVHEYSDRELTYPDDKLPALAGLAKFFMATNQDQYVAGMWLRTLYDDIRWARTPKPAKTPGRPRNAPSWSWIAAADGGIYWPISTQKDEVEKHAWKVESIHDKTLSLSGHVTSVFLDCLHDDNRGSRRRDLARRCLVWKWASQTTNLVAHQAQAEALLRKSRKHATQQSSSMSCLRPLIHPRTADLDRNCGEIFFDYKFWKDNDELDDILAEVTLFDIGKLKYFYLSDCNMTDKGCFGASLILRRIKNGNHGHYFERLGMLFFHADIPYEEWQPFGEYQTIFIT